VGDVSTIGLDIAKSVFQAHGAEPTAMSENAQAATGVDSLEMLADRGYFSGEEIVACEARWDALCA
jgi:hypothetical protein